MEREQRKKIMTGAGIAGVGLGIALLLGSFNLFDIDFFSGAIVAVAAVFVNAIYLIFKGKKEANNGGT